MRSKTVDRLLKSTPKDVEIFVDWYADLVVRINQLLRENDISTKRFRELASEVGSLLTYEATAGLETEKVTIEGWNGPVEVDQIKG